MEDDLIVEHLTRSTSDGQLATLASFGGPNGTYPSRILFARAVAHFMAPQAGTEKMAAEGFSSSETRSNHRVGGRSQSTNTGWGGRGMQFVRRAGRKPLWILETGLPNKSYERHLQTFHQRDADHLRHTRWFAWRHLRIGPIQSPLRLWNALWSNRNRGGRVCSKYRWKESCPQSCSRPILLNKSPFFVSGGDGSVYGVKESCCDPVGVTVFRITQEPDGNSVLSTIASISASPSPSSPDINGF